MDRLDTVLQRAWINPPYIKGNFVREYAQEIAVAASMGLITTRISDDTFGRQWFITPNGLTDFYDRYCC
jgi:hypothetical protein